MQKKTATPPPANLYQLAGHGIHFTYSASGIDGQPHLEIHDAQIQTSARGDDIRVHESEIGTLVTISVRKTVDTGSTTLTVLLPRVVLDATNATPVHTYAIRTVHRFSVIPAFNTGQRDLYEILPLTGHASAVMF